MREDDWFKIFIIDLFGCSILAISIGLIVAIWSFVFNQLMIYFQMKGWI